ncbi:ABC transporter ATP-binding protein, partial [Streptomyces sp. NPDC059766]
MRPRSVISGRQRWDVRLVLGRPRTAEVLAAVLRRNPGITEAQASPVTGGLLVRHDGRVQGTDVGRLVRGGRARGGGGAPRAGGARGVWGG